MVNVEDRSAKEILNDYFGKEINWDYNNLTSWEQSVITEEKFNLLKKKYCYERYKEQTKK